MANKPHPNIRNIPPLNSLSSNGSTTSRLVSHAREGASPLHSPRVIYGPSFQKDMELRSRYEALISKGNNHPENLATNLYELRKMVLLEGIPPETEVNFHLESL